MTVFRRLPAYSGPSRANGKTESECLMFALIAALVFIGSFLLAAGTIIGMFLAYRDKMVAALTFEPIPQEVPVYPSPPDRQPFSSDRCRRTRA